MFFNTDDFTHCFLSLSQSSSPVIIFLLLIATHACIPALFRPMPGRAKICAAALAVLQPLQNLSQNMQQAFLDPPLFASVCFVTVKYCQT
jgi:hypothetical protein